MNPSGTGVALLCLMTATVLVGCPRPHPETMLSLDELITLHNANAREVPRLWARARIAVTSADGFTWGSTLLSPNAKLLLQKSSNKLAPHYFLLVGSEVGTEVFRLGSSPDEGVYYFWVNFGKHGGAWYGRHEFAGAPGIEQLPLDPNQVLSVLSIFALPDDQTKLPVVALSMSTDPFAYVVTYIDRQPLTRRIGFRREVYYRWSDREAARPFKVNLFDSDGRRIMTARLKNYKEIDTGAEGTGQLPSPVIPTDIRIEWSRWRGRENRIRSIHMVLSDMTTTRKGDPRKACRFDPQNLPAGMVPVSVDEHLLSGRTGK